jgi:hypothetical protein
VLGVLTLWERQGGYLTYGRHAETSCFPNLDVGTAAQPRELWPLALYPVTGTAEVVFQHLTSRPPFDDAGLRRELLTRFNEIDGIVLSEAKLALRPSFPLSIFTHHSKEIAAVLEWFLLTVMLYEARGD